MKNNFREVLSLLLLNQIERKFYVLLKMKNEGKKEDKENYLYILFFLIWIWIFECNTNVVISLKTQPEVTVGIIINRIRKQEKNIYAQEN